MDLPQTTPAQVNLLSLTNSGGPTFNTRNQAHQHLTANTSNSQPGIMPKVSEVPDPAPKSLTGRQIGSSPTDADNWPILQKDI